MKIKIIACLFFNIVFLATLTKAASWSSWNVTSSLTSNHSIYVYTNKPTSITIQVVCTRSMGETNFTLKFAVGSSNPTNSTFNIYSTFSVTSADFENYSPGSVILPITKTITIDSRTQSLGDGRFTLYGYLNNSSSINVIYTPSFPFLYIPYQGTFDQFPSRYANTLFNYATSLTTIPFTKISVSDSSPVLVVGQKIYSPSQKVYLTLQTDGNVVLRKINTDGSETSLWSTETQGKPSASLYLQTDGNLVIYPGTNTPANHVANSSLWGSNINATGLGTVHEAYYRLQDDGNFVFCWPNYYSSNGLIYIVAGASDTGSGVTAHQGSLVHPLWSPAMQQVTGANFTPLPQ